MNTGKTCQKCGGLFQAVLPDRPEDEWELARLFEQERHMEFIRVLRSKTRCDLKDAKGTMQHISRNGRLCHRCHTMLGTGKIVDCPKCGAMNIVLDCELGGAADRGQPIRSENNRTPSAADRVHFASLLLASHMGVLGKSPIIEAADKRICEVDNPDPWLLQLSSQGDSQELEELIVRGDECVYLQALRLAYRAWDDGSISDERFAAYCRTLLQQPGDKSRWYDELLWVDNEFSLVAQGVFRREESIKKVKAALEDLLEREP